MRGLEGPEAEGSPSFLTATLSWGHTCCSDADSPCRRWGVSVAPAPSPATRRQCPAHAGVSCELHGLCPTCPHRHRAASRGTQSSHTVPSARRAGLTPAAFAVSGDAVAQAPLRSPHRRLCFRLPSRLRGLRHGNKKWAVPGGFGQTLASGLFQVQDVRGAAERRIHQQVSGARAWGRVCCCPLCPVPLVARTPWTWPARPHSGGLSHQPASLIR